MHNWKGDTTTSIYDRDGNMVAKYEYDDWGNVLTVTDANNKSITDNNPAMNSDPTGESSRKHAGYSVGSCEACNPDLYRLRRSRPGFVAKAYSAGSKKGGDWKPRKDSRKGSENRQPTGARECNKAHPNGEEHSRVPKGNGLKRYDPITLEKILATEVIIISAVFIVYLVANDVTSVGVIDDAVIIPVAIIIWEAAQAFA